MKNVSDIGGRKYQSTHLMFNSFFKIVPFEIKWKILQSGAGHR
jgi:hypothetical protein